ncbi:hypothetical protein COU76_03250 [Candidatus Peregrinibacteria bacterium CG10_big_fil_rev_8_21_14_0_10_49_10]|nr:MAG: hypothetical protein COU76_03250 [Candidatus Peregrinibacteria bacterium CG10_big_fil_rev_8_21_14_0_10_49_10]
MTNLPIFLSVFLVSLASLTGVFLLSFSTRFLQKVLLYLVSFATGALFANVFLHILPEMTETTGDIHTSFILVLVGIVLSFAIEKFIHWHHCHNLECHHAEPVGTMVLIGDGVHNMTDGILIATTYLVDVQLGIATTIAVILHEIPQEIGDFAVLLHSGFSRSKALLWNFVSALTAFIGAFAVLLLREQIGGLDQMLLPLVAGNFLYIAGSDLIPELHKESVTKNMVFQLITMIAGILLMYSLVLAEHAEDKNVHTPEPTTSTQEHLSSTHDLIHISAPQPGERVGNPVIITGEARGMWFFEAVFPVVLLDANGNELAASYATANGEWMTEDFVSFTASVSVEKPETPTGTLVLKRDNPSGLPEYDAEVRIPVRFE